MHKWAFIITSLFSLSSFAVITNPANLVDFKAESVCRIITVSEGTTSICTGSLVQNDLVLTANHCVVGPTARVEVGCGYQGFDPKNITTIKTGKGNVVVYNVSFKEMALGRFTSADTELDQAFIKLDRKLSITPMKIGGNDVDLSRPCLLTGYGINKNGNAGVLLSAWVLAVVNAQTAFRFDNVFESTMPDPGNGYPRIDEMAESSVESTMQGTTLLAGDSGGPFLCYNKQGELTQVAVNNSIQRNFEMRSQHLYFEVASYAMKVSATIRSALGL